ncbi:hypothetical protein [Streptomyces sp. NPDC057580]
MPRDLHGGGYRQAQPRLELYGTTDVVRPRNLYDAQRDRHFGPRISD